MNDLYSLSFISYGGLNGEGGGLFNFLPLNRGAGLIRIYGIIKNLLSPFPSVAVTSLRHKAPDKFSTS